MSSCPKNENSKDQQPGPSNKKDSHSSTQQNNSTSGSVKMPKWFKPL